MALEARPTARTHPARGRPFTLAVVGADGSGKSTVTRLLEQRQPVPLRRIYMGFKPAAATHMLPTSWLWWRLQRALGRDRDQGQPRDPDAPLARPRGAKRLLKSAKAGLRLVHQVAEEWYRLGIACYHRLRGRAVLYDRHFFPDYHAHDVATADAPLSRRIHGWLLTRVYPRPQVLVLLDAPAEVLFARKQEGTVALLERRRQEYLALRCAVPHFHVVDAAAPLEDVAQRVAELLVAQWGRGDG